MLVSAGRILKVTALLVPPGVVTVMLCGPLGTVDAITRVAEIELPVIVGVPLMVKPVGKLNVEPTRPVPAKVTGTVVPATPCAGVIDVSVGTGAETVKVRALLVPPGVVTVMLCAPN